MKGKKNTSDNNMRKKHYQEENGQGEEGRSGKRRRWEEGYEGGEENRGRMRRGGYMVRRLKRRVMQVKKYLRGEKVQKLQGEGEGEKRRAMEERRNKEKEGGLQEK